MSNSSESSGYVLKFISGKYQGGEFPLEMDDEIIIGRSSDLDMVLVEDMVSRRHARITTYNSELYLEDFGSTNGSFVNGEKITKARLSEGDRILIGTNIIKLVHRDRAESSEAGDQSSAPMMNQAGQNPMQMGGAGPTQPPGGGGGAAGSGPHTQAYMPVAGGPGGPGGPNAGPPAAGATMTGSISGLIEEVPLPDLLQLFSTSRKSGVLVIHSDDVGKVYLREGRVFFASINDQTDISPLKAFYRLLAWKRGTFSLEHPTDETFENEINESVESLMMEGMRQLDEIQNLGPEVPDFDQSLTIPRPLEARLAELDEEQLDAFQLVYNQQTVSSVLNQSDESDLETMRSIVHLIRNDYVKVSSDS